MLSYLAFFFDFYLVSTLNFDLRLRTLRFASQLVRYGIRLVLYRHD